MLVVDASVLIEVLVGGSRSEGAARALAADPEWAAPHCIDAEVLGVVRRDWQRGVIDETTASLAVHDLAMWPGHRIPHPPLLARSWELRHVLRSWDALYVALAEQIDCPLATFDRRLARAVDIQVVVP